MSQLNQFFGKKNDSIQVNQLSRVASYTSLGQTPFFPKVRVRMCYLSRDILILGHSRWLVCGFDPMICPSGVSVSGPSRIGLLFCCRWPFSDVGGMCIRLRRQMQELKIEERHTWKRYGCLFDVSRCPRSGEKNIFSCSIWRISKCFFLVKRLKTAYFHVIERD